MVSTIPPTLKMKVWGVVGRVRMRDECITKTLIHPHPHRPLGWGMWGRRFAYHSMRGEQEFRRTDFGSRLLAAEGEGGEGQWGWGVCLKWSNILLVVARSPRRNSCYLMKVRAKFCEALNSRREIFDFPTTEKWQTSLIKWLKNVVIQIVRRTSQENYTNKHFLLTCLIFVVIYWWT
jgi:hypothetical protein